MVDNQMLIQLSESSEPVEAFLGFDSDPDTSKVRQRVASYVQSCGERYLSAHLGKKTPPPPIVMVIVLHGGPNLPKSMRQTVKVGSHRITIDARLMTVDMLSLDDMISLPILPMMPYYIARFDGQFGEIEEDPERRRTLIADLQRIADTLSDPEAGNRDLTENTRHMLMTCTAALIETRLASYPITLAEAREVFNGLVTEEEVQAYMEQAYEEANR